MANLSSVPLFARMSANNVARLERGVSRRTVRAGGLVLRRGARCEELLVIAEGALRVHPIASRVRDIGAGEVLGEMSLVSGAAASATVKAIADSVLWVVPGALFLELVDAEPSLGRALLNVLAHRLRTSEASRERAAERQAVVLVEDPSRAREDGLARALELVARRHLGRVRRTRHELAAAALEELESWRPKPEPEVLLLSTPLSELAELAGALAPQDAVLAPAELEPGLPSGLADLALLRADGPSAAPRSGRWAFPVDTLELQRVLRDDRPDARDAPKLERLARWVARKEIGIALGAGAARGFAHLGVLAELEALGVVIDRISGTSMGGIAGLLYALAGNGEGGIELAQETLGRRGAVRLRWLPRSSIFSDAELRRRARAVAGERTFADLGLPVAVAATDLVRGERVVIERGGVADGFFATSAVPGVLPPVVDGEHTLVDGALVARIPLDLLPPSRCGLRIAVNVLPSHAGTGAWSAEASTLRRRIQAPFGFREVLGRSWNHLGWNHGARDAADADLLLEPRTHEHSGVEFATSWKPMVEAGRVAVREHQSELLAAAAELLGPD